MKRIDRTGEVSYNNFGSEMRIINYRNNKDIDVFSPSIITQKSMFIIGVFKKVK